MLMHIMTDDLKCCKQVNFVDCRAAVSDSILSSSQTLDFSDSPANYEMQGGLLNADAVYVATFSALSLNLSLLKAGFYFTRDQTTLQVVTEVCKLGRLSRNNLVKNVG